MSLRAQMRYMNPYDVHKMLINQYILKKPGDTALIARDKSKDKTDYDVLKENHKFLWDEDTPVGSWEAQFAKRYYDKLYKEYCIGDLSRYKENKIALRWRIEQEVITGKGQFTCGNKKCNCKEDLKTWEVNFAYQENGERKNALVKIRLCPECSAKLNYCTKKREVKRLKRHHSDKKRKRKTLNLEEGTSSSLCEEPNSDEKESDSDRISDATQEEKNDESPWLNQKPVELKSRDEEMEEYLEELLL